MNRNKIERWILSEHHLKRPTLVFILTLIISVSIVTSMLLYILNIHNKNKLINLKNKCLWNSLKEPR